MVTAHRVTDTSIAPPAHSGSQYSVSLPEVAYSPPYGRQYPNHQGKVKRSVKKNPNVHVKALYLRLVKRWSVVIGSIRGGPSPPG